MSSVPARAPGSGSALNSSGVRQRRSSSCGWGGPISTGPALD
jgi:hypothetical protein